LRFKPIVASLKNWLLLGSNINRIETVKSFNQNIVYSKLGEAMPGCTPCVVPCAIIKAIWTELGMALKKNAKIQFTT
jgi:hypothetical protein